MIRIDQNYTDYRDDSDPNYPGGKAIDAPDEESHEGTPIKASWKNDINGFRQALFKKAFGNLNGISNQPDNANVSDSMNALNELLSQKAPVNTTLADAAGSNTLPGTSSTPTASILQVIRNNLKYLINKIISTNDIAAAAVTAAKMAEGTITARPIPIAAGTDLNSLSEGYYSCLSNNIAQTLLNTPWGAAASSSAMAFVLNSCVWLNNGFMQTLYRNNSDIVYTRWYYSYTQTWRAWVRKLERAEIESYSSTALVIDTNPAGLQAAINSLPKFLRQPVTIRVQPGTEAGNIAVERFYGPGSLTINCVDANNTAISTVNTQTHKVNRVVLRYNNTAAGINVTGFTATCADDSGIYCERNSCYIYIGLCNAVSGQNSTSGNTGISVEQNTGQVNALNCTFSNKYRACSVRFGSLNANSFQGTGNSTAFYAQYGGVIYIRAAGSIAAAEGYSAVSGSSIIPPNGIPHGAAPLAGPVFTGTPQVAFGGINHPLAVAANTSNRTSDLPPGSYIIVRLFYYDEIIENNSAVSVFFQGRNVNGVFVVEEHIATNRINLENQGYHILAGTWRSCGRINTIEGGIIIARRVA